MEAAPAIGLGCMRLSTVPDRDPGAAIAALHAAFDAGVTFLDTADAYCLDHTEIGHNERLIASALASWRGDRSRITVATKGGLTRPQGQWIPDGRGRHLAAACDASLRALGVDRLALYQLHVPDPKVPLSTSVRALEALVRGGLVERVGLCNVTVGQLEEARRIADIASVQVEISLWHDDNLLSGVAAYCLAHGIRLMASRPLGGTKRTARVRRDPLLSEIAARLGATPAEVALAWLSDLSPSMVSLPGATRIETVRSVARASRVVLTDEDRARLDERWPSGRLVRAGPGSGPAEAGHYTNRSPVASGFSRTNFSSVVSGISRTSFSRTTPTDAEIVLIMGLPAAGKSTLARTLVADGFERVNRDVAGGTLRALVPAVDSLLASGRSRIVMDNTYLSRKSRAAVLQAASMRGVPVRGIWLSTSLEDAQVNAASRILANHGRLLGPEDMREAVKHDVSAFGPGVLFRHQRTLEPPSLSEGFAALETRPFVRTPPASAGARAILIWCDGILWRRRSGSGAPRSADEVEVVADRAGTLRRYAAEGWHILGLSWQPGVAAGTRSAGDVDAAIARLRDRLAVDIDVLCCAHPAGPPVCWCRKPLPGLGVVFIERYRLDPSRCVYVGDGPIDPGFARRLGFEYRDAAAFFGDR